MNTLFLMVGISGSGKSVFGKALAEALGIPRFSSDEIRGELCNGDMTDQSKNGAVFDLFRQRVEEALQQGNVIADATNVKRADRDAFRKIALRQGAKVTAVVMNTCIEDAKKFNESRDRVVPAFVLDKQFNAYTVPTLEEVSEIWYVSWQEDLVFVQRPGQFEMSYYTTPEIFNYGKSQKV